jgi:asparagine synthase (glutamine-hydrolysing)
MRSAGFRVLLDGTGGDELAGNGFHHRMSLLRRGKWLSLAGLVRERASTLNVSPWGLFFDRCLRPAAPEPLKKLYRRLRRGVQPLPQPGMVPEAALEKTGLRERPAQASALPSFRAPMKLDMYLAIFSGWAATVLSENYELIFGLHGIEVRQPYRDRHLVEFALALPEDQLWRNGRSRFIFRTAMQGIVPELILQRRSKGIFLEQYDAVLAGTQAQEVKRLSENLVLVRLGIADASVVRTLIDGYQHHPEIGLSLVVSDLIALELRCREILGECQHTIATDEEVSSENAAQSVTS